MSTTTHKMLGSPTGNPEAAQTKEFAPFVYGGYAFPQPTGKVSLGQSRGKRRPGVCEGSGELPQQRFSL